MTPSPAPALAALSGAYFVLGVGSLAVVGLVGPIAAAMDSAPEAIAFQVTVFAVTYALAAPALQVWFGHWPRRRLLLTGAGLIALGALGSALAQSLWALGLARVGMAIGGALVGPMASAAGAALVPPERRGAALGAVFAGMTLATVLGVPLSSFAGGLIGWRAVMVVIAVAALVVGALIAWLLPRDTGGAQISAATLVGTLQHPVLGPAIAVMALQMAAQFVTYALIGPFLVAAAGEGTPLVPVGLMVFGVGGIVGNALATRLVERAGADRLIRISLAGIFGLFLLLFAVRGSAVLSIGVLGLWAVTAMLMMAPQQARLIALAPERQNLLLALNASALYLGMAIGAAIAGILAARLTLSALPLASAALALMALGAFQISRRAVRRAQSPT